MNAVCNCDAGVFFGIESLFWLIGVFIVSPGAGFMPSASSIGYGNVSVIPFSFPNGKAVLTWDDREDVLRTFEGLEGFDYRCIERLCCRRKGTYVEKGRERLSGRA